MVRPIISSILTSERMVAFLATSILYNRTHSQGMDMNRQSMRSNARWYSQVSKIQLSDTTESLIFGAINLLLMTIIFLGTMDGLRECKMIEMMKQATAAASDALEYIVHFWKGDSKDHGGGREGSVSGKPTILYLKKLTLFKIQLPRDPILVQLVPHRLNAVLISTVACKQKYSFKICIQEVFY